jgi:hypothetical protein
VDIEKISGQQQVVARLSLLEISEASIRNRKLSEWSFTIAGFEL